MVARKESKKIHSTWAKNKTPKLQNAFHPKVIVKEIYCVFDVVGCMLISEALIYTSDNTLCRVPHRYRESSEMCFCKSDALIPLVPHHSSFLVIVIS